MTCTRRKCWNRRMSEERLRHLTEGEEFEREDINPRVVFFSLLFLAAVIVVVYFLLNGFYSHLNAYQKTHQPPQNPLVKIEDKDTRIVSGSDIKKFPEPRLEENE